MVEYLKPLQTVSIKSSDMIVDVLSNQGVTVSQRWASLLVFFIAGLLVYFGIKITQPMLKWLLLIGGGILLIGAFIPW